MDEEPDRRTFLLGAVACLPVIGGAAELFARAARHGARHPARVETAKIPVRPVMEERPEIPVDVIAEVAAERREER